MKRGINMSDSINVGLCATCDHCSCTGTWCMYLDEETDYDLGCKNWQKDEHPEDKSGFIKAYIRDNRL